MCNWREETWTVNSALEILDNGNKLYYIRILRALTDLDLRECKDLADNLQEGRRREKMRQEALEILNGELSEDAYNYIETLING